MNLWVLPKIKTAATPILPRLSLPRLFVTPPVSKAERRLWGCVGAEGTEGTSTWSIHQVENGTSIRMPLQNDWWLNWLHDARVLTQGAAMEKGELTKLAIVCAVIILVIVAAIPILGWSKVMSIVGETAVYVLMAVAVLSIPLLVGSYYYGKQSDSNDSGSDDASSSSQKGAKPTRPLRGPTLVSAGLLGAAVLVAILLGGYLLLSRGDYQTDAGLHGVHAFQIRDVQFMVRQPARFVLLQDRNALERIVHPSDNELHIAFITVLDASRIMNGEDPLFDRYVTIQSNRKLDATAITPRMFREVKASITKEGLGDAIARNKRTINDFIAGEGHHVDEIRAIGFTETHDSYTLTALVKQRAQGARVNTVTMRNLRGCCIVVATTALCRTQDDIDWSQTAAAECASSLN